MVTRMSDIHLLKRLFGLSQQKWTETRNVQLVRKFDVEDEKERPH